MALDVFDEIAPDATKSDVFDEIAPEAVAPKKDIFDEISPESVPAEPQNGIWLTLCETSAKAIANMPMRPVPQAKPAARTGV